MPGTRTQRLDSVRGRARSTPRTVAAIATAAALVLLSGRGFGQVPPRVPPGQLAPGQIEREFEQPRIPPRPERIIVPAVPQLAVPPDADKIRFVLRVVSIDGMTVYTPEQMSDLYVRLIGQEVSLAAVFALAAQLTARYRNDGYVLSQVVVPEQRIADGRVRLQAIEGFIGSVVVAGEVGTPTLPIEYAAKIVAARPLTAAVLERYLLLMNDLAGMHAQAELRASRTTPGASDMYVALTRRPVEAFVEVNNRGSRLFGPWRVEADVAFNSRFGQRVQVFGASTFNDELRYVAFAFRQPLGAEGLSLELDGSFSRAKPNQDIVVFPFETDTVTAAARLVYPLKRSRAENLYLRGAFTYLDGTTEVSGVRLIEDRVRALRFGFSYDLADRWLGVNLVDFDVSQGLELLGASRTGSPNLSNPNAQNNFTKLNLYAARLQGLAPKVSLLTAMSGQYSFDPLLPSEQFGYGGAIFGRAYDTAELLGDSGIAGKLELRYTEVPEGLRLGYALYTFYEIGQVWRREPISVFKSASAADAGLGLRLNAFRALSGYVEVAWPLTRDVALEGNRDPRVFGAVRWTF